VTDAFARRAGIRLAIWRAGIRPRARSTEVRLLAVASAALVVGWIGLASTMAGRFEVGGIGRLLLFLAAASIVHVAFVISGRSMDQILLPTVTLLGGLSLLLMERLPQSVVVQQVRDARLGLAGLQTLWLLIGCGVLGSVAVLLRHDGWLRSYKYTWAAVGIGLLLLVFVLGEEVNGARLSVRVGPFAGQPSELLKVILVVFLAGYLADNRPMLARSSTRFGPIALPPLPYLLPMLVMWGLAILIVIVQRDLGAALLLFGVFLAMLYVATRRISYVVLGVALFLSATAVLYSLFPHVRVRIDIWLNPFADPLGTGYQVIRGIFAFGRGGVLGTGMGAGLPQVGASPVIPAIHTDFVFAALGEELGFLGAIALCGLYLVIAERGLRIAVRAADEFQALLAAGLTLVVVLQAAIIMGGNLRLIPLTGITLPFVSYGGSSILANSLVAGLLLALSDRGVDRVLPPPTPPRRRSGRRIRPAMPRIGAALARVGLVLVIVFATISAGAGWWQVVEAGTLTSDPSNPLLLAAERSAPRGRILDRRGQVLAVNVADGSRELRRRYPRPAAAPVVGYRSLLYGHAGLEASYDMQLVGLDQLGPGDEFLRKFRPDPYDPNDLWLSLDIQLQELATRLLGNDRGAVVAIEPATGRVLALATSPTYDPNSLTRLTSARRSMNRLQADPDAPLLDRATQGAYPPGSVFKIVTAIAALEAGSIQPSTRFPDQPRESVRGLVVGDHRITDFPRDVQLRRPLDLFEAMEVSSNVYFAHAALEAGAPALARTASLLGIGAPTPFELPTVAGQVNDGEGPMEGFGDPAGLAMAAFGQGEVLVTPLQMAMVVAAVANDGVLLEPRLVDRLVSENGDVRALEGREVGRVMSSTTADAVGDAMVRAVEGRYAAGFAGAADVDGVRTAGKSGSAEVADGRPPHSWFVGFAPAEAPRIAIAVVVENAGSGSKRAVPMGGRLMSAWLRRLGDR
jgi:peptidoglycan glycosyltransferase